MKNNVHEIEQAAISKIALLIGEFSELFAARVGGSDMGALDAIERDWTDLRKNTGKVYQQMVNELTVAVDERDIIAKKKPSGADWE